MTKLHDLHAAGQSVWLDFIARDMIESGELASLIAGGIRGLTSNPTIFQKAIAGSSLYDDELPAAIRSDRDLPADQMFEMLAVTDIRAAADLLEGVFKSSGGADGHVSLEVSPHLAHDTEGTIAEAMRLWDLVDRPNLMIKVPATPEGVPALEELTAAGINVNATLMFSLESYTAIAKAYVRGARRADEPSSLASVASFFVSRVDTKTDEALEKVGTPEAMELRGSIAVVNAKLAYREYRRIFSDAGFGELAARGVRPQRVLWASTSTKNPEYNDVLYVDNLIGPNTVNTLPPATIEAFVDHGSIDAEALTTGVDAAQLAMEQVGVLGIDFDQITDDLQDEGVRSFADSYDDLLATLSGKIEALTR